MKIALIEADSQEYMNIQDHRLKVKGAYVLHFSLKADKNISVGKFGKIHFPLGHYLYMGNAYGSGGLKARLMRHARIQKKQHWHFDYIRPFVALDKVTAYKDGHECDLVALYIKQYQMQSFYQGLGSSDCRRCQSHFLYKPYV